MRLDNSLYHSDGVDAIRHIDAILEIDELDALQWTPRAGKADGLRGKWFPLYDKVRSARKSLWILVENYNIEYWIEGTRSLIGMETQGYISLIRI